MAGTNVSNKWVYNLDGASSPLIGKIAKVQAGSTATFSKGDLLKYSGGYWIRVTANTDYASQLVIAAEDQLATDVARYVNVIIPRAGDVFQFALATADDLAWNAPVEIVDHDTVQVNTDTTNIFGYVAGLDQYPADGTTLLYKSNLLVRFRYPFGI